MTTRRSCDLGPDLTEVRTARAFVAIALDEWGGPRADDIAIVTSELVTNALVHASSQVRLAVERRDDCVRVEVADGSAVEPIVREVEGGATTGRGLRIVEQLVDRWGVEADGDGKLVWVEVDG